MDHNESDNAAVIERAAVGLGGPAIEDQDVAQETAVRVFVARARGRIIVHLGSYARVAARSVALDAAQRAARSPWARARARGGVRALVGTALEPATDRAGPFDEVARADDVARVRAALSRMRPRDADLLIECYSAPRVECVAAAKVVGMSRTTTKVRLFRARERFVAVLAKGRTPRCL